MTPRIPIQRSQPRPRLFHQFAMRILLHKQPIPLPRRSRIVQIVLIDLCLRQQRSHPQRTPRILHPQKLILPHRSLRTLHIAQPAPLLRQQLRHRIHAVRSMHIPWRIMVDRTKSIHRPRIVCMRSRSLRNRLQHLASPLRLLPRSQLYPLLSRSPRRQNRHHRAAQHHRANPTPPSTSDCSAQAHSLF